MLYDKIITIKNDVVEASFLLRGATWVEFRYLDGPNVLVAYEDKTMYMDNPVFLGSTVGPLAGRIKDGYIKPLELQLSVNNGTNQLHGGYHGTHTLMFEVTKHTDDAVVFEAIGNHQDDGYPGLIHYRVSYSLKKSALTLKLEATPTERMPLSISNHAYFNLSGSNDLSDHELWIESDTVALNDKTQANSGMTLDVINTPFDFKTYRGIETNDHHEQFNTTRYLDHDYFLKGKVGLRNKTAELLIKTNVDVMRVYSANFFDESFIAEHLEKAKNYSAIAFEPQHLANGINLGYDRLYDKEHPFRSETTYELRKRYE